VTCAEHIKALLDRERAWSLVRDAAFGPAVIVGPIMVRGPTGKEYRFRVRIELPRSFPDRDAHPEVWLLESPFPHRDDAHVDEEGNVCVELHRAHEIDYARVGLVGFFEQVVLHLDRLRIYSLTGKYPGPAFAHGDAGIREYLREVHAAATKDLPRAHVSAAWPGVPLPPDRQWCGCGSGRRFRDCHKAAVKDARKRVAAAGPMPRRSFLRASQNPTGRLRGLGNASCSQSGSGGAVVRRAGHSR
jgi:hypothetical protein